MKKAWRVTFNGSVGIIASDTRSKARAAVMRLALEVYDKRDVSWVKIKVIRAPEFDGWAEQDGTGNCWDETLLPKDDAHAGTRRAV